MTAAKPTAIYRQDGDGNENVSVLMPDGSEKVAGKLAYNAHTYNWQFWPALDFHFPPFYLPADSDRRNVIAAINNAVSVYLGAMA